MAAIASYKPSSHEGDASTDSTEPTDQSAPDEMSDSTANRRTLRCEVYRSTLNHQESIVRNPYYGPYGSVRHSYEFMDVSNYPSYPRQTDGVGPQIVGFSSATRLDFKGYVKERLQERSQQLAMGSLMNLYREGLQAKFGSDSAQADSNHPAQAEFKAELDAESSTPETKPESEQT
jgi:hypothetical protein